MSSGEPSRLPNAYAPEPTWDGVLGELEAQVVAFEDVLAAARADEIDAWNQRTSGWVPPTGLGPLPPQMRERAARLLQSQLEAAERIVAQITSSRRQRDLAARMSYATRPVPAYVDRAL